MTNKALKRVIKKKQVKKNIRKKLLKRTNTQPQQQLQPLTPRQSPGQSPSQTSTSNNSLRTLLMARNGLMYPAGFSPQQYGNINNEKRINELRNDNQMIQQRMDSDNITIASLQKENAKLKDQRKEYKKQLKEARHEYEKNKDEVEAADDDLQEKERIEAKNQHLKQQLDNLNLRNAEVDVENNILQNKKEIKTKETELLQKQMEHQRLQNEYNQNDAYQRLQQLTNEIQDIDAKISASKQLIESDDFQNTNEALINKQKEFEQKKYELELQTQQMNQQRENAKLKFQLETVPAKDLVDQISTKYIKSTQALLYDKLDLEDQAYEAQSSIRDLEHAKEQERKMRYEAAGKIIEVQYEQGKLDNIKTSMPKGELQKRIEEQAKEMGKTEAQLMKAKRKNENALGIFNAKFERVKNDAYNEEMKKDLDDTFIEQAKETGRLQEEVTEQEELSESVKAKRKAEFNANVARSRNDYENSPQIRDIKEKILSNETQTALLQKEADERNILSKAQEKAEEANIALKVMQNTADIGLTDVQQVNYIIQDELNPRLKEMKQKELIFNEIKEVAENHPQQWDAFVQQNPLANNLISQGNWKNLSLKELNDILKALDSFMKSYSPSPPTSVFDQSNELQPPVTEPQIIQPININNNNNNNNDEPFVEEEEENN